MTNNPTQFLLLVYQPQDNQFPDDSSLINIVENDTFNEASLHFAVFD